MTAKVKEIIDTLKNEKDEDELYSILIDCGKKNELTNSEREQLEDTIFTYCNYPDDMVRAGAIKVLCFYWGLKKEKYRNKAFEMFNNKDEEEETRTDALMSWATTYENTMNKDALLFIYNIINNKAEDKYIRACAHNHFFIVSNIDSKDLPNIDLDWDNLDNEIDWNLLDKILKDAK